MNTQHIDLDISKSPTMPQHVRIGQGDSAGTTIEATIYDNGVAATLMGMSARFCMRLPGGMQYVRDSGCTVSGSTITYVVDEEHCAAVKGRTDEAYFELLATGSVVYSTNRFTIHVLRGVTDGAVPGEPYDSAIDEAIERANEAAEAAEEAAGGVTPLMSANTLGGAKLGDGLSVDANEKLNVDPLTTSQIDDIVGDTAVTSNKVLNGTGLTYLFGKLKQKFAALVNGVVTVAQGGTGKDTHTANAVLTGNGTSAVNNIATASGALYATAANGAASFGTLPVAQGGTGATAADTARANLGTPSSSSIASVESATAGASHAKDSHFMLNGELRKATSAIASGESITNSNSTTDTVQGQIDTLRDSLDDSGWLVLAKGIRYRKCVGILYVQFAEYSASSGSNVAGTLPDGFRPSMGCVYPLALITGSYVRSYVMLESNGNIIVTRDSDGIIWGDISVPL